MRAVSTHEMKELERLANESGLSYAQMMENAGIGAVEEVYRRFSPQSAVVFAGRGNNGGDALVAARVLHERGVNVIVVLAGGEPTTEDAKANLARARALGLCIDELAELHSGILLFLDNADLVVDGIYGTGFHGELSAEPEKAAALINDSGAFVLALDVPSGVEADSGRCSSGCVRADLTVAFHRPKYCHESLGASLFCGDITVIPIGIVEEQTE